MLDFINSTEKSDTLAIVTDYIPRLKLYGLHLLPAMSTFNPVRVWPRQSALPDHQDADTVRQKTDDAKTPVS
jgi:hypothetical protein